MNIGLILPLGYGVECQTNKTGFSSKNSVYRARYVSYYRSQRLDGEMVSNQIQGAIKASLSQIMEGMKELNWDGREIKHS